MIEFGAIMNVFLCNFNLVVGTPALLLAAPSSRKKIISAAADGVRRGALCGCIFVHVVSPLITWKAFQQNQWKLAPSCVDAISFTASIIFQTAFFGFTYGLLKGSTVNFFRQ